jgi:hypothetical protein
MTAKQISDEMRKYLSHKSGAASRGIPFLFTFEQWWEIWQHSGHWHERGHGKDKYCMARPGDIGPYAVGNVKIVTNSENFSEAGKHNWVGRPRGRTPRPHIEIPGDTLVLRTEAARELAQLSLLKEKTERIQWEHTVGLHYRAEAGTRAAVAVMRGCGCGGRSSLSCLTNNFWSVLNSV